MPKIILASKSKVRKKILDENDILNEVKPSNVDEDIVKLSLLKEKATPEIISKNLAELKANKVSNKYIDDLVLGADSVIDLEGELISKPNDRNEALEILKKNCVSFKTGVFRLINELHRKKVRQFIVTSSSRNQVNLLVEYLFNGFNPLNSLFQVKTLNLKNQIHCLI